jgi:hypothetical protein
MDAAARLHRLIPSAPPLLAATPAQGQRGPLTIIRRDRPHEDPATVPATRVQISPAARALADAERSPKGPRPGKDEPAQERVTPAANETHQPTSRNHMPDQLGPLDSTAKIQGFGGLNVRRSVGGIKLTNSD